MTPPPYARSSPGSSSLQTPPGPVCPRRTSVAGDSSTSAGCALGGRTQTPRTAVRRTPDRGGRTPGRRRGIRAGSPPSASPAAPPAEPWSRRRRPRQQRDGRGNSPVLALVVEDGRGQLDLYLVAADAGVQVDGPGTGQVLAVVLQGQRRLPRLERHPIPKGAGGISVPAPMRIEVDPGPPAKPQHEVVDGRIRPRLPARSGEQVHEHVVGVQVSVFSGQIITPDPDGLGADRDGA